MARGTTPEPLHPALARRGTGITADGEFYMPTRALFGRGIAGQAAEHAAALGASSVLLVTDPGVRAAGLIAPVETALAGRGIDVTIFDLVEPNPKDEDCLAGAELMRAGGQQLLVAVGGGSAIDTAKCIGLLLTNGGHPRDWEDFGALRRDPLPTIAIPTTAGHRQRGQPVRGHHRHGPQEEDEPLRHAELPAGGAGRSRPHPVLSRLGHRIVGNGRALARRGLAPVPAGHARLGRTGPGGGAARRPVHPPRGQRARPTSRRGAAWRRAASPPASRSG